jgi:hypothetical protein
MAMISLTDIAHLIDNTLKRCERRTPKAYYNPGAYVEGRRIHVWTHSYQPAHKLTKAEALTYLTALR